MLVVLGIAVVYSIFCVYQLWKKLHFEIEESKVTMYVIASFIIMMLALSLPLYLHYFDPLTASFVGYLGLYFITMFLFIPDEIVKEKYRVAFLDISNYILYFYLVVFVPIAVLNMVNTLAGFSMVLKAVLVLGIIYGLVFGLRYLEKAVRGHDKDRTITIGSLVVLVGGFILLSNRIAMVNVSAFDERDINNAMFDDDYYISNDFSFEISNLGTEIFDYTIDDNYIYLVTSNAVVDTVFVSVIDKETFDVEVTHEFYPNDLDYMWHIHREHDLVFTQGDKVYFPFIDGIYIVNDTESIKISDIGDQTSHKFIFNNQFRFIKENGTNYEIHKIVDDTMELVDTISDPEGFMELNSINNSLSIKNSSTFKVTVYPDSVYDIPSSMISYPVISIAEDGIMLSNDLNDLVLEFGGKEGRFEYYIIDTESNISVLQVDEYINEIRNYDFKDESVIYKTFPSPKVFTLDFVDVVFPYRFINRTYENKEYSMQQRLMQKDDGLYSLFYKTEDYKENRIYVEINQVQKLPKSFDLGWFTSLPKESYIVTIVLVLAYAGNYNLKRRDDYVPKSR